MGKPSEPDIYGYLDYRQFLRDWFQWKKKSNSRYSHRLFARKAGQRSPSLLLAVIEGRRNLTPTTTQAFGKAMSLGVRRHGFFELLVALNQAELLKDRERAMDGILATKRFQQARKVDGDLFRVFGEWHYGAICELARCEGFRPDPAWIAKTLRPNITAKRAEEALATLLGLGLLKSSAAGEIEAAEEWMMPEFSQDVALLKVHETMLERAKESVGLFPKEQRIALAFTGSMPKNLIPTLNERIERVFQELAATCEQEPRQMVYQMNFMLFPLSDPEDNP
jgi:uncharacterized protein (TIGR02147 family)